MIGVFVRKPYARKIVSGEKTYETRTRNTLQKVLDERIAIVETGNGKPMVVGYTILTEHGYCAAEDFDDWMRLICCIPKGSKYDCHGKGKWLYTVIKPEETAPYPLPPNAIRHGRVWCEFDV